MVHKAWYRVVGPLGHHAHHRARVDGPRLTILRRHVLDTDTSAVEVVEAVLKGHHRVVDKRRGGMENPTLMPFGMGLRV